MKYHKMINQVVNNNLCHGCGTCVSLCPNFAIKLIIEESKGIYLPKIDPTKCNQCGICYRICPGHSVNIPELSKEFLGNEYQYPFGYYLNCYTGHINDYDIRFNSSSGGLVPAVLIYALEKGMIDGALVTRMRKNKPLEPEPFIARTKEEIVDACGSKYCPVPANLAVSEVTKSGGKYAVVGLPCHIQGIRKAEMVNKILKKRIVLHIGIFCGYTRTFLGTEYLLKQHKISKENLLSLTYRGQGWPGNMTIKFKTGEPIQIPYKEYNNSKFCSFVSSRCTLCPDQTSELADIAFGDAWLPEITKLDNTGTSIVVTRKHATDVLLSSMVKEGVITLNQCSFEQVFESQSGNKFSKSQNTRTFIIFSKLVNRKVPDYNLKLIPTDIRSVYANAMLQSQITLASRRYLWYLFDLYYFILTWGERIKNKFIRKSSH